MEKTFLYLSTTGHKTGKQHRIEIWYVEVDSRYYIVSERFEASHWVQNIRANSQITFSVGTREQTDNVFAETHGVATIISPENQPELAQQVRQAMDTKYSWSDGLIICVEPQK